MRTTLFASAALMGLAFALPAVAQQSMDHTTPDYYLTQALGAVQQHDGTTALSDIAQAENLLLEPPTPYEYRAARRLPGEPRVIREFGDARVAVQEGNWSQAEYFINTAMSHPSAALPSSTAGTVLAPAGG